ncbi:MULTISPECIES: type II and III secretion system protein family protein [unclassified Brevundimonas]|uniref:type II and III secretion system protein family protein n=1 Tax=unclassified Brevundimonas TaxID=2622653 RepID=UPI0025BC1E31|nr:MULTISPECIES: type II and III secretion system protein family protein [unclassified Brevundimonas]
MKPLLSLAIAATLSAGSMALPAQALASGQSTVSVGSDVRHINLPRGSSFAVNLPADVRDIVVTNPAVANAMLHTHRRITVVGLAPGETDAVFVGATGRVIMTLKIRVDAGVAALQDNLSRMIPGSAIRAEAVNDNIVLSGTAANLGEVERAAQLARAHASDPSKVVNMISVEGSDQVTLKVRVVEVQRNAIKQLGFNTQALINGNGRHPLNLSSGVSYAVNSGLQGGLSGSWQRLTDVGSDLTSGRIDIGAFERVGLARTLAEPNLTSVNGEAASFLAGGEFPVPANRDQNGQITVEYKPYGVGLSFRPVVLSEGRINLQVKVEVSELNPGSGLTIGAGTPSAITLPGLTVRRSDTTVEIPSGGAMMIAGLLQETTRQAIDSLPGMTNLPVLGQLFRSRDYLMGETELVVIVEPYIVNPTSPSRMQTPADGLQVATDAQSIFFGQLNQVYGSPASTSVGRGWNGPVGYVIE